VAARSDGVALAWGDNSSGQLGDGTLTSHVVPRPVTIVAGVTHVAAGPRFSVAVSDGQPFVWGRLCEPFDCLGPPSCEETQCDQPAGRTVTVSGITQVAAGDAHIVALGADGSVWAWGENLTGQLGDGTTTGRFFPQRINAAGGAVQVAAGAYHTVVLVARPPVIGP
jgi:alpha-tubulin suppressor-like RCC1 family protein